MEGNNINGNIAFLRDTFLDAEKEYLKELMKDDKYKMFVEELNKYGSRELSLEAIKRISDIETGRVKEADLERVETEITLLLASIQDCVREKVKSQRNWWGFRKIIIAYINMKLIKLYNIKFIKYGKNIHWRIKNKMLLS